MRNIDTLLDRVILASGGMTATIYFLAFLAVVYRLSFSRAGRPNRAARVSPLTHGDVHAIMCSVAVAFFALFIRYGATAMGRMEKIAWGSFAFDVLALSCDILMMSAATFAIYAASRSICGCLCSVVFFVAAAVPGGFLYLWS